MTRPVDVRRASAADLPDVLALWSDAREEAVGAGRVPPAPAAQVHERLARSVEAEDVVVLLASWDGRPAGYAVLRPTVLTPWNESSALTLEYLYVGARLRRHGIARALMLQVTAVAERHGIEQVISHVAPTARDMHRFYARLGFAPMVVRRVTQTSALRRRLSGDTARHGIEDLISRRRSLRARAARARIPGPVTLELPVIGDTARPA